MLSPALREPRCPRHWSRWTGAGLLTPIIFLAGFGLAAPGASAQKDEPSKEEPKKQEPKTKAADKDESKKSAADKEIDEVVEAMLKTMPLPSDPRAARQIREQMERNARNMTAEQRKSTLEMIRRRNPFGVPPMPPVFAGSRHDARLGVRLEPASAALAEQLDLPKGQGLVVREVLPNSAASKAGLKTHDVLLELNGKPVANRVEELTRLLADIKANAAFEVVVLRKGKKETIKEIKLAEARENPAGFPRPGIPPFPGVFPPPGVGGAPSVITTMTRTRDHVTLRHQEGSLIITLTGQSADGKVKINAIRIQDGLQTEKYDSAEKVPEHYRDKVANLIEMSEKGSVRIDIKSP